MDSGLITSETVSHNKDSIYARNCFLSLLDQMNTAMTIMG